MYPKVFITAISAVRSRMDMAMVAAVTSRMVKTTTAEMLPMNNFTLPSMLLKLSWKAFSVSVLVGAVLLRNMSSTVRAINGTASADSAWMQNDPATPCPFINSSR